MERELTGWETEPGEAIYFKLYKSRIPVIEQTLETSALMLGSDKTRGYYVELICADFLAGANLQSVRVRLDSSSYKQLCRQVRERNG